VADKKTPDVDEDADGQTNPDTQNESGISENHPDEALGDAGVDLTEKPDDRTPETERVVIEKETVIETRSGFGTALFGGIVAACVGFILARAEFLDPYLPEALKAEKAEDVSGEISQLQSDLSSQAASLAGISDKVDGIAMPDLSPLETRIDDLSAQLAPLTNSIDTLKSNMSTLDDRLTAVEKRPIDEGVSEEAIAAYERELASLQAAMATQRTEVESLIAEARAAKAEAGELEAEAAAAAQQAANRATMANLRASLDAGAPFADEVAELEAAGVAIPAELSGAAADGVTTLTALSNDFPPSARAALAAARAENAAEDRGLQSFLKRQLGARSIEPREGDDPDAVLSRAEVAVAEGRIQEALDDISKLPEAAQAAMNAWIERAQTRLTVSIAADSVADRLNSN
jgi:hypothetical protein